MWQFFNSYPPPSTCSALELKKVVKIIQDSIGMNDYHLLVKKYFVRQPSEVISFASKSWKTLRQLVPAVEKATYTTPDVATSKLFTKKPIESNSIHLRRQIASML